MKITFMVSDITKMGGVQKVVSLIANALIETGVHDIEILSICKSGNNPIFELINKIKVSYLFPKQKSISVKRSFILLVCKLNKYLKNNSTTLIFSGIGYGLPVYISSLIGNKNKIIGWEHQNFYFGKTLGLEWIGKRISVKRLNRTIVLTQEALLQYKDYFMKSTTNVVQIPNPIDSKLLAIKAFYDSNSKKIISVGSLSSQKGFDIAIKVGRLVFDMHPDWEWHVYGTGAELDNLNKLIKEQGVQENFFLKGQNNDIYSEYRKYSMYVATSRHEGLPMVLLEAQANLLPIVSFDFKCGPKDLIQDNINGFIVPCFDENVMANKICELIQDTPKRISFSNKSSINLSEYSMESVIDRWHKLLKEVSAE